MNCPKCSTPIYRNMKFCPNCGENVEAISCVPVCPSCQHEIGADDAYCKYCGANTKTGLRDQSKKPSYMWAAILIVVWFVCQIIVCVTYSILNVIHPEFEIRIITSAIIGCVSAVLLLLPAIAAPHKVLRIVAIVLALIYIAWTVVSNIMMLTNTL